MTPLRDDYILRAIEKVAAMLRAALGLKGACAYSEALQELDRAESTLLGERAGLIGSVDAATASSLFGDAESLALYARLFAARADILRGTGDVMAARANKSRALDLALEAERRGAAGDDEFKALLENLRRGESP